MKYFYILDGKKLEFTSKNEENINIVLKKKLNKNLKDLNDYLEKINIKPKLCNICKKEYNPHFKLVVNIDKNNYVTIVDLKYGKGSNNLYDKNYCYAKNKQCPGIKMNPNSIEFISLTLGLNKKEALNYIHKNNKSPFYKENHKSITEYKKSQSRNKLYFIDRYGKEEGEKRYNIFSDKLKYTHSKQYYINKYGKIDGLQIWNNINKRKAITLANLQLKYGKEEGEKRYNNWINTCSKSNEFYIIKYGELEGINKINKRNEKRLKTLESKGNIFIPKDKKFEYMLYSHLVWEETKFQLLLYGSQKFGKNWQKHKFKNKLHLDHMYSIKMGFINNIDFNIIGNIENLNLIPEKENLSKKGNCSINIIELINNIKSTIYD